MHFSSGLSTIIVLVIISFIAILVYAEISANNIVKDFKSASSDSILKESLDSKMPIELGGLSITYSDEKPESMPISRVLSSFFPLSTDDADRSFSHDKQAVMPSEQLRSINYNIAVKLEADDITNIEIPGNATESAVTPSNSEETTYYQTISINVGELFFLLSIIAIVLFVLLLLSLITTGLRMRKAVNRALAPLRNLREATEAFADSAKAGSATGAYSEKALRNLARSLNAINTTGVDQRIPSELVGSELRPLAAAINEMIDRIDESYSAQTRFVSDASHELRTPIAVIQGYANLLLRWGAEDPKTLTESIEAIKSEADSMKQMVNQLLFLARGDAKSMKLDYALLDLSKLAREVLKEEIMIDQAHVFDSNIEDNIFIYADSGLIKQLFRILLDNSIKYTEAGGHISIRLEKTPPEMQSGYPFKFGRANLVIQDEGTGIPPDILPHIFDRFVRADESRTRNTGGAGLGLSIAKWIVEKNDGYIGVISNEGIGTRFTITLPISNKDNISDFSQNN